MQYTVETDFQPFSNIARQSNHSLSAVKGLGKVKIVSLLDAFNKPFVAGQSDTSQARPSTATTAPASTTAAVAEVDTTAEERLESPKSPEFRVLTPPTPTRPRDQGPSRSPSIEPDDPSRTASDTVWRDPLEDDDDEEDNAERDAKRQRR